MTVRDSMGFKPLDLEMQTRCLLCCHSGPDNHLGVKNLCKLEDSSLRSE